MQRNFVALACLAALGAAIDPPFPPSQERCDATYLSYLTNKKASCYLNEDGTSFLLHRCVGNTPGTEMYFMISSQINTQYSCGDQFTPRYIANAEVCQNYYDDFRPSKVSPDAKNRDEDFYMLNWVVYCYEVDMT